MQHIDPNVARTGGPDYARQVDLAVSDPSAVRVTLRPVVVFQDV